MSKSVSQNVYLFQKAKSADENFAFGSYILFALILKCEK